MSIDVRINPDAYQETPGEKSLDETPASQTRREARDARESLTRQQLEDQRRAGKLVMKVLHSGASLDQVIPVDGKLSRGQTSPIAIATAQETLRGHGVDTILEKVEPESNKGYDSQLYGDYAPAYDTLRVNRVDRQG